MMDAIDGFAGFVELYRLWPIVVLMALPIGFGVGFAAGWAASKALRVD